MVSGFDSFCQPVSPFSASVRNPAPLVRTLWPAGLWQRRWRHGIHGDEQQLLASR